MHNGEGPTSAYDERRGIAMEILCVVPSGGRLGPMPDYIDFKVRVTLTEPHSTSIVIETRVTREYMIGTTSCSNADFLNEALAEVGITLRAMADAVAYGPLVRAHDDYRSTLGVRTVFDWEEIGLAWEEASPEDSGARRPAHLR